MKLRKWLAGALSLTLLVSAFSVTAFAAQKQAKPPEPEYTYVKISTPEELQSLAKLCRLDSASKDLYVTLENDISLVNRENFEIPTFGGIFDGQGHTVSGLSIDHEGAVCGFFRYIQEGASVKNLKLAAANIVPQGTADQVGTLAGVNSGTIENCSATAVVRCQSRGGILVGTNAVTGVIADCTSQGFASGSAKIGGLSGENLGVIRNCVNRAKVNTTVEDDSFSLDDLKLSLISGITAATDSTDIGGIAGYSSGVIRDCRNAGNVGYAHTGYNIGGIAGRQDGVMLDCSNNGEILGRKEVAGIAGQMEPSSTLVYTEDTIQKVKKQLTSMQYYVDSAVQNTASTSSELHDDLTYLYSQAGTSLNAAEGVLNEILSGSWSDDSITSAANNLSNELEQLLTTAAVVSDRAGSGVESVVDDLSHVAGSVSAINGILNGTNNRPKVTEDVSEQNLDNDGAGKLQGCVNTGHIVGDVNTGGVVGAIARENDLDPEDDFTVDGNASLNFTFKSRAVVYHCTNQGEVTADKRTSGGIVGFLRMGSVLECESYGFVNCENAGYVGGIAGKSASAIRRCAVKCTVRGVGYVGGIAGEGYEIEDCRAMVTLKNSGEYTGAIAGHLAENGILTKNTFVDSDDFAGVDGISYQDQAVPVSYETMLEQPYVPDYFRKMYVTFTDGKQTPIRREADYGQPLKNIPTVTKKAGCSAAWEPFDANAITSDLTIHAVYTPLTTVLSAQAEDTTVLAEGAFGEAQMLHLEKDGEGWLLTIPDDGQEEHTIRVKLPNVQENYHVRLSAGSNGSIVPAEKDGSYLVFTAQGQQIRFHLEKAPQNTLPLILALCGGAAVIVIGLAVFTLKKKKVPHTLQKTKGK